MNIEKTEKYIVDFYKSNYKQLLRESGGAFKFPFIAPSSSCYSDQLWDWDSWLCDIAIRQGLYLYDTEEEIKDFEKYEEGSIKNYLSFSSYGGIVPILITRDMDRSGFYKENETYNHNMHKPCLAQHAAFLTREKKGDISWIRDYLEFLMGYLNVYKGHFRDKDTGLYFFVNDDKIGVDNDPCTFFRPDRSSASIYLNCFMYKELLAAEYLMKQAGYDKIADDYKQEAKALKDSIKRECYDEKDGFYYSVDLALRDNKNVVGLHSGMPRYWNGLIQRIGVWSGFLAMWAGIASEEEAERMVKENYLDENGFKGKYGVRSISKYEKMYSLYASNNPSNWCGPVWVISNYFVFRGLLNYNYTEEARELAERTIEMLSMDLKTCGELHEYYDPDTGKGIMGKGFQSWNYLVINMLTWLKTGNALWEF